MDRNQLEAWLDAGLSVAQIGATVDRHPSTVSYWLKKHGLIANGHAKHSSRGGLPRQELEKLVGAGETLAAIADRFDVSIRTVRYWVERYELPPPRAFRRSELDRALEEGRRTLFRNCRKHGSTVFVIENSGRTRCRRCRMQRVTEWRRRVKARLVAEAGGRCRVCGYDACPAALGFHHRDPAEKSFELSLRGATRSMDALRAEAAKCVLLCANCHAEVEAGYTSL